MFVCFFLESSQFFFLYIPFTTVTSCYPAWLRTLHLFFRLLLWTLPVFFIGMLWKLHTTLIRSHHCTRCLLKLLTAGTRPAELWLFQRKMEWQVCWLASMSDFIFKGGLFFFFNQTKQMSCWLSNHSLSSGYRQTCTASCSLHDYDAQQAAKVVLLNV